MQTKKVGSSELAINGLRCSHSVRGRDCSGRRNPERQEHRQAKMKYFERKAWLASFPGFPGPCRLLQLLLLGLLVLPFVIPHLYALRPEISDGWRSSTVKDLPCTIEPRTVLPPSHQHESLQAVLQLKIGGEHFSGSVGILTLKELCASPGKPQSEHLWKDLTSATDI